jgi:hypothetical protein
MSSLSKKIRRYFWIWLIVTFAMSGCADNTPTLEELSQSYKQNLDYESLVAILPYLNSTLTRADVEEILGKPENCVTLDSCLYTTTKILITHCQTTDTSFPQLCADHYMVLTVSYFGEIDSLINSSQDVLWTFDLHPVRK